MDQEADMMELDPFVGTEELTDAVIGRFITMQHSDGKFAVDLSKSKKITDLGLKALAKSFTPANSLSLHFNPNITDDGVIEFLDRSKYIEKLQISTCGNITDKVLEHINGDTLRELTIFGTPITNAGMLYISQHFANLSTLLIGNEPHPVNDYEVNKILCNCKKLEKFEIYNATRITDALFKTLLYEKTVSGLKEFVFYENDRITDKAFQNIGEIFPSLLEFHVGWVKSLSDLAVSDLVHGCKNLKAIRLFRSPEITGSSFRVILEELPKLEKLHLERCCNMDFDGVSRLGRSFKNIKELGLAGENKITHYELATIIEYFPNVETFELTNNNTINDSCLDNFAPIPKSLVLMDLSLCRNITSAGVVKFAEKLGKHVILKLNVCVKISDDVVKYYGKQRT